MKDPPSPQPLLLEKSKDSNGANELTLLPRDLLLLLSFAKHKAISMVSSAHTMVSGFFILLFWLLLETCTTEYPDNDMA